jgi:protein ImuA
MNYKRNLRLVGGAEAPPPPFGHLPQQAGGRAKREAFQLRSPNLLGELSEGLRGTHFTALMTAGALHEVFSAAPSDAVTAGVFALGVLKPKKLFWARQHLIRIEAGEIYPPGLLSLGFDPSTVTLVRLKDAPSVLQAGLEAARCRDIHATILELWGEASAYTLTASRKLTLACKASGSTLVLIRHAAQEIASSAESRWRVKRLASVPLPANAPGNPACEVTLLRHRKSVLRQSWCVEWNNEQGCFEDRRESAALSQPVVPVPALRADDIRRTG